MMCTLLLICLPLCPALPCLLLALKAARADDSRTFHVRAHVRFIPPAPPRADVRLAELTSLPVLDVPPATMLVRRLRAAA